MTRRGYKILMTVVEMLISESKIMITILVPDRQPDVLFREEVSGLVFVYVSSRGLRRLIL